MAGEATAAGAGAEAGAEAGDAEKTASETSTKRKAPPMAILFVDSEEVFLFSFCGPKQTNVVAT